MRESEVLDGEITEDLRHWESATSEQVDPSQLEALARLATQVIRVSTATICFLDKDDQWQHVHYGPVGPTIPLEASSSSGRKSKRGQILEFPDTNEEEQWLSKVGLTGPPQVRYYAEIALVTEGGRHWGRLCVSDEVPRSAMGEAQRWSLKVLADQAAWMLKTARISHRLHREVEGLIEKTRGLVVSMSQCGQLLMANESFRRVLGFASVDAVRACSIYSLVHAECREALEESIQETIHAGQHQGVQLIF